MRCTHTRARSHDDDADGGGGANDGANDGTRKKKGSKSGGGGNTKKRSAVTKARCLECHAVLKTAMKFCNKCGAVVKLPPAGSDSDFDGESDQSVTGTQSHEQVCGFF